MSWGQLFSELPVGRELFNSTLICVASILLILAVLTTAGFAFAKLRYRGSGMVFLAVVAALMVPLQSIIIPEYVNLGKLGLINTYLGAILRLRRARHPVRHVPDGHLLPGHLR